MLRFVILIFLPALATAQVPAKLENRRQSGDLAIQARQILKKYCSDCHGEKLDRTQLSVITHSQLISKTPPVPFVSRETTRHQMLEYIEDGSMPPGGRPRPDDKEIKILKDWAAAQSPSFPKAFDDATTLEVMLTDWANVEVADQRFMRYISLAHIVSETDAPTLGIHETKLRNALMKLNDLNPVTAPIPVDDTATLFRFDLRTMGWETRDLFEKMEDGMAAGVVKFTPFDLLLTDYPHSPIVPRERLETFLNTTEQIRPVPYVRGDWLANALVTPTVGLRSLGEDLQSVMALAKELKNKKPKATAGPKFREDQAYFNAKEYVGSVMPPVGAWYLRDVGPEKQPFKLKFEAIDTQSAIEAVKTSEPFQLSLETDRDIHFHILMVQSDGEIKFQKINKDSPIKAGKKPTLIATDTNMPFKISSIINGQKAASEYFILLASEQKTKPPVIIRSKHEERPIYRIVPQDGEPSAIYRAVLPIRVTN